VTHSSNIPLKSHEDLASAADSAALAARPGDFPDDLRRRYETACDPRLNRGQALDLAFPVTEPGFETPASRTAFDRAGGGA
jgi:hypothetical protein